jgi:pantoate--beta-alanine ligase
LEPLILLDLLLKVAENSADLNEMLESARMNKKSIGFVPTMGALHRGHIKLVAESQKENDVTVVSIFVNPTQFNNREDFEKYPSTLNADLDQLKEIGCDIVFTPQFEDVYPDGEKLLNFDFKGLDKPLEGEFRPGHFQGVVSVVSRFFELVKPTRAYFGEKDYQQLQIIKLLANTRFPSIQIIPVTTARSESGLALSSRNARLSNRGLQKASEVYKTVLDLKQFNKLTDSKLQELIKQKLSLLESVDIEYVRVLDAEKLTSRLTNGVSPNRRLFLAFYVEAVRLIDNIKV